MSDLWDQRDDFFAALQKHWTEMDCPVSYYPGTNARVDSFAHFYKEQSTQWMGNRTPGSKANHMLLLVIEVDADVSTEAGLKNAKEESAFRTEAFSPILMLTRFESKRASRKIALRKPSYFAINACSCSDLSHVPFWYTVRRIRPSSSKVRGYCYECMLTCYTTFSGVCGGVPGEQLGNVESGIGHVNNALFLPHVEKTIVRMPRKVIFLSRQSTLLFSFFSF